MIEDKDDKEGNKKYIYTYCTDRLFFGGCFFNTRLVITTSSYLKVSGLSVITGLQLPVDIITSGQLRAAARPQSERGKRGH